jgi:hypothetical protein
LKLAEAYKRIEGRQRKPMFGGCVRASWVMMNT